MTTFRPGTYLTREAALPLNTALVRASNGVKVAVICRAQFEAVETAKAIFTKMDVRQDSRFTLSRSCIKHTSGGMVEFCWLASASDRRVDDFDAITLLQAPANKGETA